MSKYRDRTKLKYDYLKRIQERPNSGITMNGLSIGLSWEQMKSILQEFLDRKYIETIPHGKNRWGKILPRGLEFIDRFEYLQELEKR